MQSASKKGPAKKSGRGCAVAVCKRPPENASFHNFPKIEPLQKLWVDACKRKDQFNVKNAKICSNHFKPECYERDLKNELLNLPLRRNLKLGSVPTENLLPECFLDSAEVIRPKKKNTPKKRRQNTVEITVEPDIQIEEELEEFPRRKSG